MKVKKFDVSRMRNPQAFEFYNKVYQKVRYSAFTDIKPYLEAMKTANEEFDVALKIIRKNIITEDITREDENRDRAWRGIRAAVQNGLNHFKPEVVLSAKKQPLSLIRTATLPGCPIRKKPVYCGTCLPTSTKNSSLPTIRHSVL